MKKTILPFTLAWLAGAVLFCGCKQNRINGEKIEMLSQKIAQLQQIQAKQGAEIQAQLNALAPMLDKMDSAYFAKNHEDAFFYHTNTLFLLLTVDRKIESQLQVADTEREAESSLAYYFHTNQVDTMFFCERQVEDAMAAQEKRLVEDINAETRRDITALGDELRQRIKSVDDARAAQQETMAADLALIRRDLEAIRARFAITNAAAEK